jgi:ADP-heptose:LPS heptosyltransferase
LRAAGYEPITLAAAGQAPIPGTRPVVGLPIRQVAGVIERAAALITGESGLWFIAAARRTPFVIVPWWLPRGVDWAAPMRTPHRLIFRQDAAVNTVFAGFREVVDHDRA